MSVTVLILGILVVAGGLISLGFGIKINEFSLGHTLILAGTTALSSGLVVIGLAAAISKLAQIAEALAMPGLRPIDPAEPAAEQQPRFETLPPRPFEAQPEARPVEPAAPESRAVEPGSPEPPVEARPPSDATVDVSASAIERLRSSIGRPRKPDPVTEIEDVPLSPNGPPLSAQNGAGYQPKPPVEEPAQDAGATAETLKTKRLDFLFRSRASRPAEPVEPAWTKRSVRDLQNGSPMAPPAAEPRAAPEPPPRPEPPRDVAILKSGIVDGMAYTLYADGSIEAQLPQGTVRFGSITELRAHIENNS
jgi:hypothetical protein